MADETQPSRSTLLGKLMILVVLAGLIAFAIDFAWFIQGVGKYSAIADKTPPLPAQGIEKEAIVVLTGDRHRIPRALELFRQRNGPLLVISGVRKGTTLTEIVNLQGDAAVNIHEVWGKIVLESKSQSTIENAYQTGSILQTRGLKRIILVTSDYHMRRAKKVFARVLPHLELVPYPVLSDVSMLGSVPTTRALTAVWFVWNEYWKSVLYRLISQRRIHPLE